MWRILYHVFTLRRQSFRGCHDSAALLRFVCSIVRFATTLRLKPATPGQTNGGGFPRHRSVCVTNRPIPHCIPMLLATANHELDGNALFSAGTQSLHVIPRARERKPTTYQLVTRIRGWYRRCSAPCAHRCHLPLVLSRITVCLASPGVAASLCWS